jgi:hypothetical protein
MNIYVCSISNIRGNQSYCFRMMPAVTRKVFPLDGVGNMPVKSSETDIDEH